MLRSCAIAVLIVFWAAQAAALEIRLLGPDGAPLAGAHVSVIGRAGVVVADRDGVAKLLPDPEAPFVLFVARPDGVALKPVTVTAVPDSGRLEVTVGAAGETLTVVSGAAPDLELPPAVASTVIGGADLRQRQPVRLTETLENVPGAGRSSDGHAAVPGLRGLPKHRTLLLLDDGRVTAERRAGPSATFLDPETVDEVEVVRGPGSVAYGSDAFGGVIRARSRMPDPVGARSELGYSLLAGSGADQRGASAELSFAGLGGGMLLGAHARRFGDYDSPQGRIANSAADEHGFRLAYQAPVGGGVLRAGWRSDLARDIGRPAPDSDVVRVFYPEENSHRLNVGFSAPGPGPWQRLATSLAWDDYRLVLDRDRAATADQPRQIRQSDVRANDYELRLEGERTLGEARLVLGFNASGRFDLEAFDRRFDYDVEGEPIDTTTVVAIEEARRDDLGLFAALSRDWSRWGLAAGVRGDWVRSENRGGYFGDDARTNSAPSGYLAVRWTVADGLELSGQVARGFRDALLSERYFRGPTGRGFVTGNPSLEPETSLQGDLALRYRAEHWRLAAYGYVYRIRDLIERFRLADDFFFRNRGEVEIRGLELEAGFRLPRGLQLEVGAHFLRGEALDDGTPTDDVPAPGAFAVLRSDPSRRWWWMVRGAAFVRDDRPGPTEQEVPGYGLLDASVGYRLSAAVQLQLVGRNLFDRSYLFSADEEAVPAPGRSLQLGVRGKIGRK